MTPQTQVESTPFPWHWDGDDLWHKGQNYEGHDDGGDPHRYTGISVIRPLSDSPVVKANKRLIAAIPDMIFALEWFLKPDRPIGSDAEMLRCFEVIARATLAKAKGQ